VGHFDFLKRLFDRPGEKAGKDLPDAGGKPAAASSTPANDELLIHFFDEYGRQMQIEREMWRKDVLPLNLQQYWNDADGLHGLILQSLNDGLAAEWWRRQSSWRGSMRSRRGERRYWGVVYIENGRLEEAQRVLEEQLARHGNDGYVLANLARFTIDGESLATVSAKLA
jgi:hypothetical protein